MRQAGAILLIILSSCNHPKKDISNGLSKEAGTSSMVLIADSNTTPTVDLKEYYLIGDAAMLRLKDAEEILKVKRKWPLAMQSGSSAALLVL